MRAFLFIISLLVVCLAPSLSMAGTNSFLFQQKALIQKDPIPEKKKVNIKGQVIDLETKEPMPFCNVFISNTLKGSTTNEKGFFLIEDVPHGQIQLVVSFIGYKTYRKTLDITNEKEVELKVFLRPIESKLQEVQIKTKRDKKWERQLKRFTKEFLGQTPNARFCQITNPYVLEFEGGKWAFTATAEQPLEIENKALGYKLKYYLLDFSMSGEGKSRFYGDVQFEPLLAADENEAEKWIKKRKEAYEGSLRHFFKSLVENRLEEEFFLAYEIDVNAHEEISSRLISRIGFSRIPLSIENLVTFTSGAQDKTLVLKRPIEILYKKEYDFLSPYKDAPYPLTTISPKSPSITIHENGWLYKPLSVELYGALAKEGVADMLPFEYLPEKESQQDIYTILKDDQMMTELVDRYNTFSHQFPNEKLFLHFDKPFYASGDNIWFNSFLTYYNSHKLIPGLNKIHVDFISPERRILKSLILPVIDGLAPGDFSIADSTLSGKYTIRAYTSEMAAYGEEYLFEKSIDIINPKTYLASTAKNNSFPSKDMDLQFFPEGGNSVAELPGVVGFKAIDKSGKGIPVKGTVLNDKNEMVAQFESNHLGMGSFTLNSKKGRQYSAKVEMNGKMMDFPLPPSLAEGYALTVDNKDPNILKVKLQASSQNNKRGFYLIGQSREIIIYKSRGTFKKDLPEIEISKLELPEGVFQLTLFDDMGIPQCERLVYIDHGLKDIEVDVQTGKIHFSKREKVDLEISVTDGSDIPVEGIASLSVVDASLFKADPSTGTITTHLLLSADLKGTIENPGYYFKDRSPKVLHDLDLLMLSQGWRRFSWEQIIQPDFKLPQIPDQSSKLAITGTVRINKRPIRQAQLLLIPRSSGYLVLKTDNDGRFRIPDVQLYDTTTVTITTMDAKGRNINATVHFDLFTPPPISLTGTLSENDMVESPDVPYFLRKSELINKIDSMYNFEGMTMLNEVQVKGRRTKEVEKRNSTIHGEADVALENVSERFSGYSNMLDFVQARLRSQNITRGPSALPEFGTTEPLYLVDDLPVDKQFLKELLPSEVERVEIVKAGATAAIYGARSGNGVVAIYTKSTVKKVDKPNGVKNYTLPAFSAAREFYSPKYDTVPEENEFHKPDIRTTLYWNPKVTTDMNGQAKISFYNSDDTARFLLTLQGISIDGRPFTKVFTFGEEQRKQ